MSKFIRKSSMAALALFVLLASPAVFARACIFGECSAMTTEFRNLELRPKSIALLPAISTLVEAGVFSSEEKVGETAILEAALAVKLEKQISSRGYDVRVLTLDEINADPQLTALVNDANTRYEEEYSKIAAFKVSGVKYRRYSIGEQGRLLANYLGVDAIALPRMQAEGSSGGAKFLKAAGMGGKGTYIHMEFALVHARTGDVEAFFGAIKYGSMFGTSLKSILAKPDKFMAAVSKTATKKMPKVGKALKPNKLKEEPNELVLYDPIDEESVLADLEGLLDDDLFGKEAPEAEEVPAGEE